MSDLCGMNEEDSLEDKDDNDNNKEKHNTSFKSFTLLNALSDLLMLPKDMLLSASIRNEVCQRYCLTYLLFLPSSRKFELYPLRS